MRIAPKNKLSTIVSNLTAGEFRYETFENKSHLVVPVVLMTEGVHNGSAGPLFYSAEELSTLASSWNGVPVPVFHPDQNGVPCSCNDPRVIERQNVGRLFNVNWEENRLKGEAWIDVEKAERVYPGLIDMLKDRSTKMEVSTGLLSQHEESQGVWNGEEYTAVVRNIRPDHLALLPGSRGACSWQDGCGIRNDDPSLKKYVQNIIGQMELHSRFYDFVNSMDNDMAIFFLEEVYNDYFIYRKRLINANEPAMYYKVPYKIGEGDKIEVDTANTSQVNRKIVYEQISTNSEGEKEMSKKNECPKCVEVVNELIKNENTHWQEQDRSFLEEMDLETLNKFVPKTPIVNKEEVVEPKTPVTAKEYIDNAPAEIKEVLNSAMATHRQRKDETIAKITSNVRNKFTKERLEAMSLEELEMVAALAVEPNFSLAGGSPVNNAETEVEPLELPVLNFEKK